MEEEHFGSCSPQKQLIVTMIANICGVLAIHEACIECLP